MSKIFNLETKDIINLELKLEGKLPIDRDELLALVNSWGRTKIIYTRDKNGDEIFIKACEDKEKYDLSKLDVSGIKDFKSIFRESNFNDDINSWDVSNATSMAYMFSYSRVFNQPLDKWNTSKVTTMYSMFAYANNFNQNLNSWNVSKVIDMTYIFHSAKSFNQPILWDLSQIKECDGMFIFSKLFEDRFNKGKELPFQTNQIKKWLKENKFIKALDVEYFKGKDLDNFLLNLNNSNKNIKSLSLN